MSIDSDQILKQVLESGDDQSAQLLLVAFFSGYPLDKLRTLFGSDNDKVVKAAAWILSELGAKAASLIDLFPVLLEHRSRYVRFFTLDAVLVCAKGENCDLVAKGMRLLQDSDEAIRWKALHFCAKAPLSLLNSSVSAQSDHHLACLTNWLVSTVESVDSGGVALKLCSSDRVTRLIACGAAFRLYGLDPRLLELAAKSEDHEVASFAAESLRLLV